jgi:hypothetical protein
MKMLWHHSRSSLGKQEWEGDADECSTWFYQVSVWSNKGFRIVKMSSYARDDGMEWSKVLDPIAWRAGLRKVQHQPTDLQWIWHVPYTSSLLKIKELAVMSFVRSSSQIEGQSWIQISTKTTWLSWKLIKSVWSGFFGSLKINRLQLKNIFWKNWKTETEKKDDKLEKLSDKSENWLVCHFFIQNLNFESKII